MAPTRRLELWEINFSTVIIFRYSFIHYICYGNSAVDNIVTTRLKRVLSSVLSLNDTVQTAENNSCPLTTDVTAMNGESRGERDYKSHGLF